jgi:hypothetical protein
MSLNNQQLYGISNTLSKIVKDEYGENAFIGYAKIIKACGQDHLAKLMLSKTTSTPEKIKVIFMTYLITTKRYDKDNIIKMSSNLYLYILDFYDDTNSIMIDCRRCNGSGEEDCERCDGKGNEDCGYCDGDGKFECDTCSGEGTEECRYCDGKGTETETEEDDEGEEVEVEVECSGCGGSGTEYCRDCGGEGEFECDGCDGSGDKTCEECGGAGEFSCGWCEGNGEETSDEVKYSITRKLYITLGNKLSEYLNDRILLTDFEELDADNEKVPYSFTITKAFFDDNDNVTKEDRQESVGLDDDFVELIGSYKLENYLKDISF